MSNIDKRALREAAEKATPGPWVEKRGEVTTADYEVEGATYLDHICNCEIVGTESPNAEFIAAANPATVLALLDELEAKDKSISFLKDQLAQLANFNPDWDKLEAATDSLSEHMAELTAARKRIAELEARTLVPVEPTIDQLVAGKRRLTSTGRMSRLMSQRLAEVYRAMVNAAAAGKGE